MDTLTDRIVEEKEYADAIICDNTGKIIWNAFQQDSPVVRRKYADGTYDIIEKRSGKLVGPRYDPTDDYFKLTCQHCGKSPW